MVEFKTGKCPKCGRLGEIIISNNPLVPGICEKCLTTQIDPKNLKQADFFCRTYNIPFEPEVWMDLVGKVGAKVFKQYVTRFYTLGQDNLYWQSVTKDWWTDLDEEWKKCSRFEELLTKIKPLKEQFIARNKIKWGGNYTFEDYVQLENLLISTLRANDITSPLQIDAIKKACKISLELDKAIEEGDSKGIKELSSAYSSFTKTAQIDTIIEAANDDVIATVADLADEIERCGGKFTYYDHVERDIVDKTISDIQTYNRQLVADATGLGAMLENINETYKTALEQKAADNAQKEYTIEDIVKDNKAAGAIMDEELESEDVQINIGDEDDEYF